MYETVKLWLPNEQKTQSAGKSLAHTLYAFPITIFLRGELGAGKTTFLQGFAKELGIEDPLTSPTYALEQQYRTKDDQPFIHIDLYRLSPADASQLLDQTDISEGIRCVEWADRLPEIPAGLPHILIDLKEEDDGRNLTVTFNDMPLPSDEEIRIWRKDVALPENVIAHCETVREITDRMCTHFLTEGTIIRSQAASKAAALHDLLRFIDFEHERIADHRTWQTIKNTYSDMKHEEAAAAFLHEKGFHGVGDIVATHGLSNGDIRTARMEQKIVYYADKRAAHDKIVTLHERFREFEERYGRAPGAWREDAFHLEKTLFLHTPPF